MRTLRAWLVGLAAVCEWVVEGRFFDGACSSLILAMRVGCHPA